MAFDQHTKAFLIAGPCLGDGRLILHPFLPQDLDWLTGPAVRWRLADKTNLMEPAGVWHRRMLTGAHGSDVSERFERLENNLSRLVDVVSTLAQVVKSHEERLSRLTESQVRTDELARQTQEELSGLIRMMDEWIRRNPGNGKGLPPAA